ncbi:MAG TPA: GntR family transcriptional regulator [Candidatus Dormibacteraeota bacterium]|nr:GntR family transcriptional regulator [Candidatus Dormibacteraeota bacterium]
MLTSWDDASTPASTPAPAGDGGRLPAGTFEFTRVRPARVSNEVVAQIREAIFSGRYQPGDRLPTERELSRQFGVSRVTVRDALRALEAAGLIEVRVGGQGGPYVTEPDVSRLTEALNAHVQLRGTTFVELSEARLALELLAAELAAERATSRELEQIQAMAEVPPGRGPEAAGALLDFHRAVVTASHNGALLDMWTACRTLIQEPFDVLQALQPAMAEASQEAHRRLARALAARDGKLAARLTREHLSDFHSRARRAFEESRRRRSSTSG